MCSLSDSASDIATLNDRLGGIEISDKNVSEKCESSKSLVLKGKDMDSLAEIDNALYEAYRTKTPKMPRHRKELMEEASTFLKDTIGDLSNSKIADVINIEGGGSVHVGHVINITEQIVINTDHNELEFNTQKMRDYSHHFTMIGRMHWLAQPPVAEVDYIESPVKYVIICHTATEEAFTQAENVLMLRLLQTFHIESQGWADIAYNFCIASDGNAYEGRGWFRVGSHTVTYNKYAVGIAFIGCFLNNLPPKTSLKRCQELIAHGVKIGAISADYELIAHCQCRPFLSPGQRLFEEIKTWKNFNPDIVNTSPCIFHK